jgi:RNA polymerase sigma-70 factor (family 1)
MQAFYQDDYELVRSLKEGEQEAFQKLYQKYHGKLYAHVIKFAKSQSLAQDVLHDVFVKIWENRASLKEELSFQSYLFTMAKNHLLNLLKRASHENSILQEILIHTEKASTVTENTLCYLETRKLLNEAVRKLPPQRKKIFQLCRQEGLSYEEVASQLGISKGTVNSQMVKSLKSIRDYLLLNGNPLISVALFLFLR